ncbi:MAG: hypothetical protein CL576_06570 [Alteromonas sp.]|nr:hypothetical protein [Alteromonas sp.]|tara:strand:- start:8543 stop:9406 length:864 start_codon:yes stop_codon:yes gene_type:complete
MAAVDLSVEELSDVAVSKLGELLAPIQAFTVLNPQDARVKSTGTNGGVYQVEVTNALPTAADNPGDYEGMTSGTQTNVAVTTANIAVMQKLTNLQQQQGIPFKTRVPDAAKSLAAAIWDKVTAMINGGGYTDAGQAASTTALTVAEIQTLRASVPANDVTLMVEHSTSAALYPSDKNSFQFNEVGAYGFNSIYPVSNFTGGVTKQMAFACSKEAAVAVSGIALEREESINLTNGSSIIENFTVESVGVPVELRIWQNSGTKDLYLTLETCFGIDTADATAGAFLDHA